MIESTTASLQLATPVQPSSQKSAETAENTQPKQAAAPSASLKASVSQQAQNLESLQQELKRLPDVDMVKVNEIRTLLASGSYEIDLDGLAASIRGAHRRD